MSDCIGRVFLVGTGPGDPGLLTLRALDAIRRADVVVYDHLISSAVLDQIPAGVRRLYAGKRSGAHSMTQQEINDLLISEAEKGRRVVRLKGGDPFVFGRGGEELAELSAAGIPCEVIPGITSASAVPLYAGIPLTFRGVSSSFHVFTGHSAADAVPEYDYRAIVRTEGTLVFLMGTATAGSICSHLIEAGMEMSMPAAAIANGTTALQKTVESTVAGLAGKMKVEGIVPPAVLVIGRTVALRKKLDWLSVRPLTGMRIIVTRPGQRCGDLCRELSFLGADAIACPVIAVRDTAALPSVGDVVSDADWITFSSCSGVDSFFRLLFASGFDGRYLAGKKIAAIGSVTAECLEKHGICADLIPDTYDSLSLAGALISRLNSGDRILSVRSRNGDSDMEELLERKGFVCNRLDTYETVSVRDMSPETAAIVAEGQFDWLVFASASAADGFKTAFPCLDVSCCSAVCIGEKTAAAVRRLGIKRMRIAEKATAAGIVDALVAVREKNK